MRFFRLDDDHPFTGRHMLAVVALFFGVIISVNVVMAVSATRTFPGLIVKNSYVASQNYNTLLASARAQAARGLKLEMVPADGLLNVTILDADGVLVRDLDLSIIAGRPSSTRYDRRLSTHETAKGYATDEPLTEGLWEVEVDAVRSGVEVYRERRRVLVPERAGNE